MKVFAPGLTPFMSLFLLFSLTNAATATVEDGDRSSLIQLRSQQIDLRLGAPLVPEALQSTSGEGGRYRLVKFPGPISQQQYQSLEGSVERIYGYLPHDTYLVKIKGDSGLLTPLAGTSWVGNFHAAYKLAPAVTALASSAGETGSREIRRPVMVQVYPDADLDLVAGKIRSLGISSIVGSARSASFSRLRLLLTPAEIVRVRDSLARIPDVFWVDLEAHRGLLNDSTAWVGQSGVSGGQATPVYDHGIFGAGQVIGVLDTGIDPDMCFFRDPSEGLPATNECDGGTVVNTNHRKILAVDFLWQNDCNGGISNTEWDDQDHGTHVAGTAAGDWDTNLGVRDFGDGMAPAAKVVIQDGGFATDDCADLPGLGCPVVDLNPIFQQAYDQGARIHTNSWGDRENFNPQNTYSAGAQDADEFMWNHKDFLLLFAAGNSGPGSGSVGSPSTGKNVISVGATQPGASAESMASFSSCGLTNDGRQKPDLTVPGQTISSANSDGNAASNNCNVRNLSGTSMASPGAAGFAALVRQYYEDGFYPSGAALPGDGFSPSAALVKASLLNSAQGMTGVSPAIPSNCQGWGRLMLDNVLSLGMETRKLWVEDETVGFPLGAVGQESTFSFTVHSDQEPFKVSLTWTDFPATLAANPQLVNDLDLEVSGPGGTWLGNVFSGGVSATGGSADRLNTVEQILLAAPAAGEYTVTVRAFNVPSGPQPFALVVTGDLTGALSPDIFADGFESGDTSAWTLTVPLTPVDSVATILEAQSR
ncbi:MAG: S8 family serine peptidase [Deltaproteobacteria bacterium]|nr:S8 family serine peptidase [Deltaproteobacteria bacterium]